VLIEAMALGVPCVGSDVTGIPEIVRHEETGLIARAGDAVALAEALKRLLADAGLRTRLSRAGRALVEQEFDIHRNAAALRAVFADCMSRAPGASEKGAA
jgi:colanic acid/amylovoran biosynthesis glycosyltransferase